MNTELIVNCINAMRDAIVNAINAITVLVLGETSDTAYRGDRGKTAYDHSQTAHAPSDAINMSTVLANIDIDSAIDLKHIAGTDQGLDTGGTNAVTASQTKTAYTHSQSAHAPVDALVADDVWGEETVTRSIYVATTGDDTTGDGSVGLPYLTIGKALSTVKKNIGSGVTVTISIGIGTFTMSADDLSVIGQISGSGTLTIQGTFVLVDSGFTMGAANPLDPFTYSVSGGNTATWTLNQWKFYFLKSGANYYPITHNALTPTISITSNVTGTEIYQAQTIININGTILNNIPLTFDYLQLYTNTTALSFIDNQELIIRRCFLNTSLSSSYTFQRYSKFRITLSCFNGGLTLYSNPSTSIHFVYIYKNVASYCLFLSVSLDDFNNNLLSNIVIENPNTGASASCILLIGYLIQNPNSSTFYIKFVNSNVGIVFADLAYLKRFRTTLKWILVNTNYFFKKSTLTDDYTSATLNLLYSNIYGIPLIRWFYDVMYEFVNPVSGRNIQITGLIYPENEQNLSAALPNNATTNVIIGNKLQNRSVFIDYSITRGTTFQTGQLVIHHDGTTPVISAPTPLGDSGVTFAVNFNTNELRLACTTTNTGVAATMKYNISRVMITPLTI